MKNYSSGFYNPLMQPKKGLEVVKIRQELAENAKKLQEWQQELTEQTEALAKYKQDIENGAVEKIQNELDKVAREGFVRGWMQAQEGLQSKIYAAVAITLKQMLKYGTMRIERFLVEVDKKFYDYIDSDDASAAALKLAGVELDFTEAFSEDRIKMVVDNVEGKVKADGVPKG